MTNETKLGLMSMPNPSADDLENPIWNSIWQTIKNWDVNVPEYYEGHCGPSGSHASLIFNALRGDRSGIYVASKTAHAPIWIALRSSGLNIKSTWIDEAAVGATTDWTDLWDRCIEESSTAAALLIYYEHGENLKGALIELGSALRGGVPVYWAGDIPESLTILRSNKVRMFPTIVDAVRAIREDGLL